MGWGAESAGRGFVPVLVGCGVPCPRVGEGGAVRYGGVVLCGGLPVGGRGTVSRSGGVGCRPWFVLWRCGAAPRGLLIVLLACFSTWAVRGRCGVGPGVPRGGVCGTGVSQPGGCGRVVLGGVGPPLSGPSGAGYCVCGVRGSVGRGFLGVLWPPAVPTGGEWRCVAGVYRFHGGGGAICSGVGWARGRLPADSGCRGLTVGGYSAVSPWCVPWWSLVGWLKGVLGVYRIHGGTIVCCGAAAVGAASFWGWGLCRCRPCGWRRCVVCRPRRLLMVVCCGGAWGVVLGFAVPERVRDMRGRVGWGGGACAGLRVCLLLPPLPLPLPVPYFSLFVGLFGFFFLFFGGGGGWVAVRGCGCVPVAAPVWAWVSWGTGVGWLLCSGLPVCAPAPRLPVPWAPDRGGLTAGGWRQWWRGACVGGCGSWLVSGWRCRA